jgi:hypothetical protein
MDDEIPSVIQLSPVQREILNLIIEDQLSIQQPVLSERVILLWSEGISESATSQRLSIGEETVRSLRCRWWASAPRIAAAEKRSQRVFNDLVSLIFHIASDCSTSATSQNLSEMHDTASHATSEKHRELRPATRALIEILHHKPKVYGINRSTWTQETLAIAFETLYRQRPSRFTVGRLLKEAGLSWKKSRRVLTSPDPKYGEKVEVLLQTLQSLKPDEDLFFVDELGPLQVKRYGGRSYTPKKTILSYPQRQQSKGSITLYGALSASTNQVTWFYGESKDSMGIIDLTEILFNQYNTKSTIYLTWDAASWHGSDKLVQWTDELNTWNRTGADGPIVQFVPLPSSAQFLDVIEAVFSGMKRAVIHNSDYQSEEEMKIAISTHFRDRNEYFRGNPKRAGKKIWQIDFFDDHSFIRSGNYREW